MEPVPDAGLAPDAVRTVSFLMCSEAADRARKPQRP
ncbi:DUF6357 family protein [Streptomyces sp. NPDC007164]